MSDLKLLAGSLSNLAGYGSWVGRLMETDAKIDQLQQRCEKAEAACEEAARQLKNANKVGLMLVADRSLLRGTLLRIAEGKQLPDSKDSDGLSAGEISVGDLRRVFRALEETKWVLMPTNSAA